jgi:hypothetical protein
MMRRPLCAVACSLLCLPLAACGSDDEASQPGSDDLSLADGYQSGSRLHAVLRVADQASVFSTWHDTELDVDCAFGLASDGSTRCVPTAGYTSMYSDADCTTPVGVFQAGEEIAPYVADAGQTVSCGKGYVIYESGDVVDPPALYAPVGGECMPNSAPDTATIVALSEVVAPDAFVAQKSVASQPIDERVSARVLTADDGARQVLGFHDGTRDVDCSIDQLWGEDLACVPVPLAYLEVHYGDSACETPVAFFPGYSLGGCDVAPEIVMDATGMATEPTFYEIGAKFEGQVYESYGDCTAYDPPPALLASFYELGAPAPLSSLVTLTRTEEGEGRIKLTTLRTEGGELVATREFYDSDLASICYPQTAADDKMRCLPQSPYGAYLYADSSCTQALVTITTTEDPPPAGTFLTGNTGNESTAVFVLGDKITPPTMVYQRNPDCQAASVPEGSDVYETEALGPTEFVEVKLETE